MDSLKNLYDYIEKENIILRYEKDLKKKYNLNALYSYANNKHCIILDSTLEQDRKRHISTLAEECGHYSTSYGNYIEKVTNENYRVKVEQCERKADEWKCKHLISDEILNNMIIQCESICEIADELNIDYKIVLNRFIYLSRKMDIYIVNKKLKIDLTRLPNLCKIYY